MLFSQKLHYRCLVGLRIHIRSVFTVNSECILQPTYKINLQIMLKYQCQVTVCFPFQALLKATVFSHPLIFSFGQPWNTISDQTLSLWLLLLISLLLLLLLKWLLLLLASLKILGMGKQILQRYRKPRKSAIFLTKIMPYVIWLYAVITVQKNEVFH